MVDVHKWVVATLVASVTNKTSHLQTTNATLSVWMTFVVCKTVVPVVKHRLEWVLLDLVVSWPRVVAVAVRVSVPQGTVTRLVLHQEAELP